MDEGLKITNEKRHKSSSSLAGILESVRSERKIDLRASIPEVDDQFTVAEAKCNDLQQKINLVKTLRRKKKLKKRSMTTIAEPGPTSDIPVITVHTQPKTTLLVTEMSQQSSKLRKFEGASIKNPRRYIDHDVIEQQQMLDRVRAYKQDDSPKTPKRRGNRHETVHISPVRSDFRGARAAGDTVFEHGVQSDIRNLPYEVSCGDDASYDEQHDRYVDKYLVNKEKKYYGSRPQSKQKETKYVLKESSQTGPDVQWVENTREDWHGRSSPSPRRNELSNKKGNTINTNLKETEVRPLVELFNKNSHTAEPYLRQHNVHRYTKNQKDGASPVCEEQTTGPLEDVTSTKSKKQKARRKYHSRRYEMPTVSSQMKQAGFRYSYSATNQANIPFVVSKSTSPSHNIGVNLQQVLNGLKVQQPLSRIPLTLAHHMGLRHVPSYGMKSAATEPILHNNEINVIKLGRRMLRLPSKYISYNRLLTLYREGDGVVPRFLRAISRPNYFYTSMYNLVSNREDFDAATSKGQVESQVAKQRLVEYANLYREYERVDKCLNEKYSPELEARKEDLMRQLATREDDIRKVVRDYQPGNIHPLRASASTAEETYRNSTLNLQSDIHK